MTTGEVRPRAQSFPGAMLSVSGLHHDVLGALQGAGLDRVWVSGAVSGLRQGPRFWSWELVEYGDDAAQVRAVLAVGAFRREAAHIASVLHDVGLELADGLEVAVYGRLDPNPTFGRIRLLAEAVDPRASLGAAVVARDKVVADLLGSGAFDAQQALKVPDIIRRVGLVTAATAAGRGDVMAVLARSPLAVEVVEVGAAMGGPQAPVEVARALSRLVGAGVDVILVARGGGARSDLAVWDSAELARAISACPTPVWVALGHAGDRTVADMAAQRSHPTPSAAAAAVVANAEAVTLRQAQEAAAHQHRVELATAHRRLRRAVVTALVVTLVLIAVVWRVLA